MNRVEILNCVHQMATVFIRSLLCSSDEFIFDWDVIPRHSSVLHYESTYCNQADPAGDHDPASLFILVWIHGGHLFPTNRMGIRGVRRIGLPRFRAGVHSCVRVLRPRA